MNLRKSFPPVLILLALGLALALPAAASALERTVSTSASATVKVRNDAAKISFSVVRERRSRGAALSAASQGLQTVIAAVKGFSGVDPAELETGRVSIRKTRDGRLYRATQGVSVVLHRPDAAGRLIDAAVRAGASGVGGPSYFVSDRQAAFAKALGAAFDKAKAQAGVLASRSGSSLGAVIAVDEGEGPAIIEDEIAGEEASGAAPNKMAPPTRPGRSTVTAFVHVVFALN